MQNIGLNAYVSTILREFVDDGRIVITASDTDDNYPANYTFSGYKIGQDIEIVLRFAEFNVIGKVTDCDRLVLFVELDRKFCKHCFRQIFRGRIDDWVYWIDYDEDYECDSTASEDGRHVP